MNNREFFQTRYLICMCAVFLILGCSSKVATTKHPIVFAKYPNLKLGFTTQNFIEALPVSVKTGKVLIDYASQNGYVWIELRDPDALLTPKECEQLAAYAKNKNIEVGYAIQKGILDDDFWETFYRGVKNAVLFEGPGTIRCLTGGKEFTADPEKKGWTDDEFERLIKTANRAAKLSEENGLRFACENSSSALKSHGDTYHGIEEFFEKVNPNVYWQFDTANFFWVPRVEIEPNDVKAFLEDKIERLAYIHLKSAKNRQALPVLSGNPLGFETVFSAMSKHNIPYVAIELDAIEDVEQIFANHEKSVEYLRTKGVIKE